MLGHWLMPWALRTTVTVGKIRRFTGWRAIVVISSLVSTSEPRAKQLEPQTEADFNCYVQPVEARLHPPPPANAPGAYLKTHDGRVQTRAAGAPNPRQIADGLIQDWGGAVFVPTASLDRVLHLLQDYGHRAQYFSDILSASKLLCRSGQNRFRVSVRLKEPTVIDIESDATWERLGRHQRQSRYYSTNIRAVGADRKNLFHLNSYWTFSEVNNGVYVEARAIGRFPVRDRSGELFAAHAAFNPGIGSETWTRFAQPPSGPPQCPELRPAAGCAATPPNKCQKPSTNSSPHFKTCCARPPRRSGVPELPPTK